MEKKYGIEKEINEILEALPSENNHLDYKEKYYDKDKKDDLIKDVIAFLNCINALEQNRYIIFGVSDKKEIKGLDDFPDDSEIQDLINMIEPKIDNILSGSLKFDDKLIGYLAITKVNTNYPYQVGKINKKWKIKEGQAFIRKGTSNKILTPEEIDKLVQIKISKNNYPNTGSQEKIDIDTNLNKNKYINEKFKDTITFLSQNNNGKFTIGKLDYQFEIKFDVATNDVIRIHENGYKIGYKENLSNLSFDIIKEKIKKKLTQFDFSSWFRRIEKNDYLILVNKCDKIVIIKLIKALSSGHGNKADSITFSYEILN